MGKITVTSSYKTAIKNHRVSGGIKDRPGDPPVLVADAKKIRVRLGWVPVHDDLEGIIYSAWQWERKRNSVPARPATISPRR
ncbi:hypothetical protein SEF58_08990 [Neomoorella humiferrea]|uniref:hypothetical protein n=1 Tax=Neomoorella humiferrea TaxID=676965 RepID=UPI003D949DED